MATVSAARIAFRDFLPNVYRSAMSSDAAAALRLLNLVQTAQELASRVEFPDRRDVGVRVAERILQRRAELGGAFHNIDEVDAIPQVGPRRLAAIIEAGHNLSASEVDSEDFTGRFLRPFETLFEEIQGEIEGTRDPSTGRLTGGIPDLFDAALALPPEFVNAPPDPREWLAYVASWIGITLRPERDLTWNRQFVADAIALSPDRGTISGVSGLLRAWLRGDILDIQPMVTDLTRALNDVATVFQLGTTDTPGVFTNLTLGVNTVVGEGPPFFFIVDLVLDPARVPSGASSTQVDDTVRLVLEAARSLLDSEKPAYSYYQLRVRATVTDVVWTFDSATGALRRDAWSR